MSAAASASARGRTATTRPTPRSDRVDRNAVKKIADQATAIASVGSPASTTIPSAKPSASVERTACRSSWRATPSANTSVHVSHEAPATTLAIGSVETTHPESAIAIPPRAAPAPRAPSRRESIAPATPSERMCATRSTSHARCPETNALNQPGG
jgi:hypothetical protein